MKKDAGQTPQTADHTPEKTDAEINVELPQTHEEPTPAQMDRRHKYVAVRVQKKAIEALARLAPEDMTANEARQLLKTAQDIERRITEGRRDADKQRDEVQALLASVWAAAKGG